MSIRVVLASVLLSGWLYGGASDVNVRDLGARGDGKTDDTAAFLQAVKKAHASWGQVLVPKGTYCISKPIELNNLVLRGPEGAAWPADVTAMPTIVPVHRDGPAFHVLAGGALRGIGISYHWESKPEGEGPTAVLISGIGAYISNVRIRYPWNGIMTDGKANVGRLNIENVFIVSPRNVGVRVTGTWDVPRLNNIEVWNAGPVKRGLEKGIGFLLGKNDLIRMTDCFVFGMHAGFQFEDKIEGCDIEGGTWGVLNGCSTDYCGQSVVVKGVHTLSISGGSFWTHQESLLVEGEGSRVRVSSAELKSNGAPCVLIRGGDHTVITGCTISRPMKAFHVPAVRLEAGNIILNGNRIVSRQNGVELAASVESAVLTGNMISCSGTAIVRAEKASGDILIENNLCRHLETKE